MSFGTSVAVAESAAGLGGTYAFRLNSPYDPDSSGVGSSAVGYSTWSALFLNYKVRRVTARVQASVKGMAAGSMATVTVVPVAGQAVLPGNKETWKMARMAQFQNIVNANEGGKNIATFTMDLDNAKIACVTKQQYDTDMDFSGQVGSNPARQNYLIACISSSGSATTATMLLTIQLTYLVEWFNPVVMQ